MRLLLLFGSGAAWCVSSSQQGLSFVVVRWQGENMRGAVVLVACFATMVHNVLESVAVVLMTGWQKKSFGGDVCFMIAILWGNPKW